MISWVGLRLLRPVSVEQLLAEAYTERRTLEVRIPGAKFAPMRLERGASGSNLDKPPSLLKAEDLIGENLQKNPNDPAWLQAKARADLLDGNYESAIKSLQLALEIQPESPPLLTDLASAYFERAGALNRPIDYGNAVEILGKTLAKSPDNPVALFNRAISSEKLFLYTQAVEDWEHYLRVEPNGDWADNARNRLAALREKLRQHDRSQSEPLIKPSEIAHGRTDDIAVHAKIDARIEEYLHIAVTEWLPQAFPLPPSEQSSAGEARTALAALGAITEELHGDSWLASLLKSPQGAGFAPAVQALGAAVRSNDKGDYSRGRDLADRAAQLFRLANNPEGELRSRAEEVVCGSSPLRRSPMHVARAQSEPPTGNERLRLAPS